MKKTGIFTAIIIAIILVGCNGSEQHYSAADYARVPKVDVHLHYFTHDTRYMELADSLNFSFVSPNVDAGTPLDLQIEFSKNIKEKYPDRIVFLGTFPVDGFNEPGFSDQIVEKVKNVIESGGSGIKVWKNIGMELKNDKGEYVMIDDPAFVALFRYLEENNIPLMAHLGEPLNCWLPLDEMTLGNDRRYFSNNPQYHMYLHPDAPSYDDQINARDNLLGLYPDLTFVGAHLASLEWNVDEVAKRLDAFPNLSVDFSARIGHLQHQSSDDYHRVRNFMIKYQDRILYGSDVTIRDSGAGYNNVSRSLQRRWMDHWIYLATDSTLVISDLDNREVKGLNLPAGVIDNIYYNNAKKIFFKPH